jgi:hypothetical protein
VDRESHSRMWDWRRRDSIKETAGYLFDKKSERDGQKWKQREDRDLWEDIANTLLILQSIVSLGQFLAHPINKLRCR